MMVKRWQKEQASISFLSLLFDKNNVSLIMTWMRSMVVCGNSSKQCEEALIDEHNKREEESLLSLLIFPFSERKMAIFFGYDLQKQIHYMHVTWTALSLINCSMENLAIISACFRIRLADSTSCLRDSVESELARLNQNRLV